MGERLVIVISGAEPDLALVDLVAQLHLAAGRNGWDLEIQGVSEELRALLDFVGLPQLGR